MTSSVTIKLLPFGAPDFAVIDHPSAHQERAFGRVPSIPLSELSDETLHAMCDDFRREVFRNAGRPLPDLTA